MRGICTRHICSSELAYALVQQLQQLQEELQVEFADELLQQLQEESQRSCSCSRS